MLEPGFSVVSAFGGILSGMTQKPVKGSVRKDGVRVRAHQRRTPRRGDHAGATADVLAAALEAGKKAAAENSQPRGRVGIVEDAVNGIEDDYFKTQDALTEDAESQWPMVSAGQLRRLVEEHRDADVKVLALRHPNISRATLEATVASAHEPKAIRDTAAAVLADLVCR